MKEHVAETSAPTQDSLRAQRATKGRGAPTEGHVSPWAHIGHTSKILRGHVAEISAPSQATTLGVASDRITDTPFIVGFSASGYSQSPGSHGEGWPLDFCDAHRYRSRLSRHRHLTSNLFEDFQSGTPEVHGTSASCPVHPAVDHTAKGALLNFCNAQKVFNLAGARAEI